MLSNLVGRDFAVQISENFTVFKLIMFQKADINLCGEYVSWRMNIPETKNLSPFHF